jgi:hypothetical protein
MTAARDAARVYDNDGVGSSSRRCARLTDVAKSPPCGGTD